MSDIADRADSVRAAWKIAIDKGYFQQAIIDYTSPAFIQFVGGLIPGLLVAMIVPILGQWGGSLAGSAIGALFGPEAIPVGAMWGRAAGGAVAAFILLKWGLQFIKDFILPQLWMVNEHLGKGMSQAWDAGGWGNTAKLRLQDAAAKEIAEGVGVLFGLILMGITTWLLKGPAERFTQWRSSFLARTCSGLSAWVENNLGWLQERYKSGPTKVPGGATPETTPAAPTAPDQAPPEPSVPSAPPPAPTVAVFEPKVIEGGLDPSTRTQLENARQAAMQVMPYLVGKVTRTVSPRDLADMDAWLTNFGYRLIKAEPYGPDSGGKGWQLFWQKGNVLVRFKTMGENAGPRKNMPHLSVGYFDNQGMAFENDLAKFTVDGKIIAKTMGALRVENRNRPPVRWTLLTADFSGPAMDTWAKQCHFNVDGKFTLTGLQAILARAGVGR